MRKITTTTLSQMKQNGEKIAVLTAYDSTFAHLFDQQGIHALLVGDSAGMVIQGHANTLSVSLDDIAYHTQCVHRGSQHALLIADLPFMSYATLDICCANAAQLIRAGADMVKMEGGNWLCDSISTLVRNGIPVCGHLGLTPQSINVFGGFKPQGRDEEDAQQIYQDALALENAGIQLLVLECIPTALAQEITAALSIPVIGIGAGPHTDGQILVMHDLLGITVGTIPRFSKSYLAQAGHIELAIRQYIEEVSRGEFPTSEHSIN